MKNTITLGALQPLHPVDRVAARASDDPVRRNEHFLKYNLSSSTYDAAYAREYAGEFLSHLERLLAETAQRGVEFVLLPEAVFMGGVLAELGEGVPPNPNAFDAALELYAWGERLFLDRIGQVARRTGMSIAASIPSARNGRLFHSGVILDAQGALAGRSDKVRLAPGPEARFYTPGDKPSVIPTNLGRFAFCICYDLFFPELVAACASLGAQIILHPSNGYTRPDEKAGMGQSRLRVRASDHRCALVYSSFARGRRGSPGESAVISPHGDVLASVEADREGCAHAVVEIEAAQASRARVPRTPVSQSVCAQLARWIGSNAASAAPADVRRKASICCMDTLAVALAGSGMSAVRRGRDAMRRAHPEGRFGCWGSDERTGLAAAIFVNATAASALDLDDGHPLAVGHAGSGVIPALFTAAQSANPTGPALLDAMIVGYEVGIRAAVARRQQNVDAFCSGNWLPVGVAAALGRVWGLSEEHQAHALAIAAAYTPQAPLSPSVETGAMVKEAIGWAAFVGVHAVELARAGFRGGLTILNHAGLYNAPVCLDGLGERWELRDVYFKPYAACRWTHAPADATLQLVQEHHPRPEDVRAVRVETFYAAARLDSTEPVSLEQTQYSIPWIVALVLRYGEAGAAQMREELLCDPVLRSLAGRVTVTGVAELEATFPATRSARVTLETARGTFTAAVRHPRGSRDNPLSEDFLRQRARHLAGEVVGESKATRLLDGLDRIEQRSETASLIENLLITKETS